MPTIFSLSPPWPSGHLALTVDTGPSLYCLFILLSYSGQSIVLPGWGKPCLKVLKSGTKIEELHLGVESIGADL